ncbi:MAG: hypothetical protein JO364_10245 [Pseudonocardiales bacterium]|nr:hypothetical protein [Pseudonocardiales bacterium]MBV9030666.1 hypothetical protein [Pseudonocardiales bacterium]
MPPAPRRHRRTLPHTLATTARRTGIGHVILLVEGAGERTRTLENVTLLGPEVLPTCDAAPNPSRADLLSRIRPG